MVEKHIKRSGIFALVAAILVFILLGAANGILGELGTTIFNWLVQILTQFINIGSLPWIIIILILLVALITFIIIWRYTYFSLKMTNRIVEFDDWLQRLVPNLVSAADLDAEMQRLMYQLLQRATAVFGDSVHRASVFLVEPDRKHLKIKYSYQLPPETVKRTEFNIEPGKSGTMRGIAGEAFLDEEGRPQVVHIIHENGKWKTDREGSYITFDLNRPSIPYKSCVCVPISVGTSLSDRLGVVCFDSQSLMIFDSAQDENSDLQKRLITLSSRFAVALQIYKELQAYHQGDVNNNSSIIGTERSKSEQSRTTPK